MTTYSINIFIVFSKYYIGLHLTFCNANKRLRIVFLLLNVWILIYLKEHLNIISYWRSFIHFCYFIHKAGFLPERHAAAARNRRSLQEEVMLLHRDSRGRVLEQLYRVFIKDALLAQTAVFKTRENGQTKKQMLINPFTKIIIKNDR